ncbi:MAG TPA: type IV toxin-antitoxin system AbiEi family antitoxin domain-containing protein [Solirubrobacterales bacterium]|nr:type IV toxin-antitoxin system AbiEi family antitoxin domain-containing protein [Solirubrobacterales bacterium]
MAELAERQHRVVSIRQLRELLGFSEGAVERMVERAYLHRLYRGVYAVGTASVSPHGACLAAVLACGPRALLSHRSAAWIWGLTRRAPFPLEVTSPTPRAPRPPIRLHRARNLTPADRTLLANVPVTSLPRTLLDYATTVNADRLDKGIERAEELGLFDLRAVDELLGRTAGHRGHKPLIRALKLYRPPPFTRSGMERHFLDLVEAAGLPKPVTGFNELGHELDVYWPKHDLVVELDLYETHGTRAAFERDRLRQDDLLLEDIRTMRVTGPRLDREPDEVIERVRRLLALRP